MKSTFALYALAAVGSAFAQSSTASQPSQTTTVKSQASGATTAKTNGASSSGIPSGISSSCATFLTGLDQDPQFATCTQPLLTATAAFSPTAKNSTQSVQTFTSTLNSLCSKPGCSNTYLRTQLANFKTNCEPELTGASPNSAVQDTYDIMYIMSPLQDALCTKDTNGTYCVTKASSSSTAAASNSTNASLPNVANNVVVGTGTDQDITDANIASYQKNALITHPGGNPAGLGRRAVAADQTPIQYAPDTQVFRDTGVAYMFTTPDLSAATLCTECTQAILTVYAAWESKMNYAMGLSRSPILGSQADLWKATSTKCGATFVSQVQRNVGPVVKGLGGALAGGSSATMSLQAGVLTFALAGLGAFFAL